MKICLTVVFGLVSVMFASEVNAARFFNRSKVQSTSQVQPETYQSSQGLAQQKSNTQASQGRMRHLGGGFGGGRYEGVGFSTVSAQDAITRCCYWGQKTPIDIGVQRGNNGWYATVIYR